MKLLGLIASFFIKLWELLQTLWGWLIVGAFAAIDFYGGYKLAFVSVFICIAVDMILGIWSAIKRKKYARSELVRDTFSKIVIYTLALVMLIHMDQLIESTAVFTNICAAIMCGTEFWSISANALIINPNLLFFKLMRPALIGEMARKLNITEDQVKDALSKGEQLINNNPTNN